MPNESFRYTKQISDQGRERSVEVRRERATLKRRLKAGRSVQPMSSMTRGNVAAKNQAVRVPQKLAPALGRPG